MAGRRKRDAVWILSVDGGGIRGLLPALFIQDLFRRVRFLEDRGARRSFGRTRKPRTVADYFDLIAGTSTGALISLGLAMPNPVASDALPEIYRRYGNVIFPQDRFNLVRTVRHAFLEKYDAAPLEAVLSAVFGDVYLHECRTNVLITAYDTYHREPFFFKHRPKSAATANLADEPAEDFLLRDVARATSAAPTYFAPARIQSRSGAWYTLVDGGLVANNPAMSAMIEAIKIFPHARKFVLVSFGTGTNGRAYEYNQIRKWGYFDWVSPVNGTPLLNMLYDAQTKSVNHYLEKLPNLEYYRFDTPLDEVSDELDDAGEENMANMETLARRAIGENRIRLHRLARRLAGYPVLGQRRGAKKRRHESGTMSTGTM